MTSPCAEEFDSQPLPGNRIPLPTERTSSPDVVNFLDPLLILTPDKPQGIPRVTAVNPKQRQKSNTRRTAPSKENANAAMTEDEVRRELKKGTKNQTRLSNPGVLFQEERTKPGVARRNQLKIIKHHVSNASGKDAPRESRTMDDIAAAKVDKMTKSSSLAGTQKAADDLKKRVGIKSCMSNKMGGVREHYVDGKKHVQIVDPKGPLSSPKLHSTAALGHELKQLETAEFNAEEVVIKTLQVSETARLSLSEKVAEAANVNKKEKKYAGLVNVGVPVDETLQRAVTQRGLRVKRRPTKPTKASELPPPDILDMFSPSMIVESANMDASGLVPPKMKPAPVDPDMTFDLYRHMQCWDLGH